VAAAHTGAALLRWHKKRNSFIDELFDRTTPCPVDWT
jgi:hypothetical protein